MNSYQPHGRFTDGMSAAFPLAQWHLLWACNPQRQRGAHRETPYFPPSLTLRVSKVSAIDREGPHGRGSGVKVVSAFRFLDLLGDVAAERPKRINRAMRNFSGPGHPSVTLDCRVETNWPFCARHVISAGVISDSAGFWLVSCLNQCICNVGFGNSRSALPLINSNSPCFAGQTACVTRNYEAVARLR